MGFSIVMHRDPRKNVPPDKMCGFVYPDDHPTKAGENCQAIKMKGSKFCYFHQPDQEAMNIQLEEARESRDAPPNLKHGFYAKEGTVRKECDECVFSKGCKYFEPGKKKCDLSLNAELDLSSLESIKSVAEEIVKTEMQRYRKLEPFFDNEYDNMELFDLSSRIAKRMTSTLKDYSAIKDIYEKGKKVENWKDIL
jgi:hypothetical protein